jgi:hypothetical protein
MYLIAFPLLLIPFALYNIVIFILRLPLTDQVLSLPLMSERRLPVTTGDALLVLAMLLFYLEVVKAARLGIKAAMDHVLSFLLFIGMASELVLVPQAATPTLLLLTVLSLVDVVAGVSVSARPKQQEIMLEGADQP